MAKFVAGSYLLAGTMLASLAFTPLLASAEPGGSIDPAVTASKKAPSSTSRDLLRLSHDGFEAMRDVRGARIAIFNGNTDLAKTLIGDAQRDLAAAEKSAPDFQTTTKDGRDGKPVDASGEPGKVDLIPVDGQISMVDDIELTPEKAAHVRRANEHLKRGQAANAVAVLKESMIDVAYTRVLMPLGATKQHVDEASRLVADGKWYEASLALKAAEDGLQVDTVAFDEPKEPVGN